MPSPVTASPSARRPATARRRPGHAHPAAASAPAPTTQPTCRRRQASRQPRQRHGAGRRRHRPLRGSDTTPRRRHARRRHVPGDRRPRRPRRRPSRRSTPAADRRVRQPTPLAALEVQRSPTRPRPTTSRALPQAQQTAAAGGACSKLRLQLPGCRTNRPDSPTTSSVVRPARLRPRSPTCSGRSSCPARRSTPPAPRRRTRNGQLAVDGLAQPQVRRAEAAGPTTPPRTTRRITGARPRAAPCGRRTTPCADFVAFTLDGKVISIAGQPARSTATPRSPAASPRRRPTHLANQLKYGALPLTFTADADADRVGDARAPRSSRPACSPAASAWSWSSSTRCSTTARSVWSRSRRCSCPAC